MEKNIKNNAKRKESTNSIYKRPLTLEGILVSSLRKDSQNLPIYTPKLLYTSHFKTLSSFISHYRCC